MIFSNVSSQFDCFLVRIMIRKAKLFRRFWKKLPVNLIDFIWKQKFGNFQSSSTFSVFFPRTYRSDLLREKLFLKIKKINFKISTFESKLDLISAEKIGWKVRFYDGFSEATGRFIRMSDLFYFSNFLWDQLFLKIKKGDLRLLHLTWPQKSLKFSTIFPKATGRFDLFLVWIKVH